jgi:Na+-transporting NADH:ubiquinone oxidoreductase subunit D
VTTTLATALTMSLALTVVICLSATFISLIRNHIPQSVRLIIQITIISALVIVMDGLLRAFAYEMSQRLSVFVGLIVTNCLVMGRAEAFAMRHPPGASFADALGNGLGYSLILILVGTLREGLGLGTILGQPLGLEGFTPIALMQRAPAAFFILGLLIWALRAWRPAQVETPEFRVTGDEEDA